KKRYNKGIEYATEYWGELISGNVCVFNMVTHSEGAALGAGIVKKLIENGCRVETVLHFSPYKGNEFSTPKEPFTLQVGYKGDWITKNNKVRGVDNYILVENSLGWRYVHGATRQGEEVWEEVKRFYRGLR
ncbi:MAG: hypothetical protein ABEH43_07250, partial [Flavobacteriales bacterium]